jgi:hypothetical protein
MTLGASFAVKSRVGLFRQHEATQDAGSTFELRWDDVLVNVAHYFGCADISVEQFHQVSPDSTKEM